MPEESTEVVISLSLDQSDTGELDDLARQLRSEIEALNVDSIEEVSLGEAPTGTKALDWVSVGQMAVTLAPTVVPPLFALAKSWVERKPSTPVKIRIKAGKKTAEIEYDPTRTTAAELEALVKTLGRSVKK